MSLLRAPDDIDVGDWLTRWSEPVPRRRRVRVHIDEDGDVIRHMPADEPLKMPGIPLKVLGVSLPYLVCGVLMPGGTLKGPEILDVRQEKLVRLDDSYVRAIIEFGDEHQAVEDDSSDEMDDFPF